MKVGDLSIPYTPQTVSLFALRRTQCEHLIPRFPGPVPDLTGLLTFVHPTPNVSNSNFACRRPAGMGHLHTGSDAQKKPPHQQIATPPKRPMRKPPALCQTPTNTTINPPRTSPGFTPHHCAPPSAEEASPPCRTRSASPSRKKRPSRRRRSRQRRTRAAGRTARCGSNRRTRASRRLRERRRAQRAT